MVVTVMTGSLTATGCEQAKKALSPHIENPPEFILPTVSMEGIETAPTQDEGTLPDTPLPGGEHHTARSSDLDWSTLRLLNAYHPEYGMIYRRTGTCVVYLPTQEDLPPGMMGPSADVECPTAMASFLWTQCQGGSLFADPKGTICVCRVGGNPPPPSSYDHCPAEAEAPKRTTED